MYLLPSFITLALQIIEILWGRLRLLGAKTFPSAYNVLLRTTECSNSVGESRKAEILDPGKPMPFQQSPLHALIIGIDVYRSKHITNLHGAVSDASAVYDFLRTEMGVPDNQIIILRDKEATRDAIIHELQALRKREALRKGDPILIYFAGHGAVSRAPKGWATAKQTISLVMTHDSLVRDSRGQLVQPLPDRTFGALLHNLAEGQDGSGKGNNITVILDCCHSGSGTRQTDSPNSYRERAHELEEHSIPSNLDNAIWGVLPIRRAAVLAPGFSLFGSNSHVLLTACREGEKAGEDREGGIFTRALLTALRSVAMDRTTYRDLMNRLPPLAEQTPQCEGRNSDRLLFNALASRIGPIRYPVSALGAQFSVSAGTMHGVMDGDLFLIYPFQSTINDKPLAVMLAASAGSFRTLLSHFPGTHVQTTLPASCYAVHRPINESAVVRLHIPDEGALRTVAKALEDLYELQGSGTSSPALLVSNEDQSELSLTLRSGRVNYRVCDPWITRHGVRELYHSTEAKALCVYPVLRAAATFFRHLHHSPKRHLLRGNVLAQVHELAQDEDAELGLDLRRPWTMRGENILHSGYISVVADQGTVYGIVVRNQLSVPLHVWAFYFDCSDLSITEYFMPSAYGNGAEPSLPAHGSLTIGYGDGGGRPFTYFLRSGQDLDVGFIKLFMSTKYVDLSSVEQKSPFETGSPRGDGSVIGWEPEDAWDTITITVCQRKASPPVSGLVLSYMSLED